MLGRHVKIASLAAAELAASVLNSPEQQHLYLEVPVWQIQASQYKLSCIKNSWVQGKPSAGAAAEKEPGMCFATASMMPSLSSSACFSGTVCS